MSQPKTPQATVIQLVSIFQTKEGTFCCDFLLGQPIFAFTNCLRVTQDKIPSIERGGKWGREGGCGGGYGGVQAIKCDCV